jgi:hypothetical protein
MTDQPISLGLELLDRQMVDVDGEASGKVDDLELVFPEDGETFGSAPYVAAILTGPGAFAGRIKGRLGRWIAAVWSRLHPHETPSPKAISWASVARLDYEVHLTVTAEQAGLHEIDEWLTKKLIERIPGS